MSEKPKVKPAQRVIVTSDVTRVRTLALAVLGAAVGAVVALTTTKTSIARSMPLPRPHAEAKVACAKCHEAPAASASAVLPSPSASAGPPFEAAGACKTCHVAAKHVSSRAPHRALAAKGQLTCATCHPAHAGAQGVTFAGDTVIRWGAGAETTTQANVHPGALAVKPKTTVPIVSLKACAKCHDPSRAEDPIASCVSSDARKVAAAASASAMAPALAKSPSLCFDEHRKLEDAGARFVAWDAAHEIATSTPWVGAKTEAPSGWAPLGGAASGAALLGALGFVLGRRRRETRAAAPKAATPAERKKLPVVNPSTCLGCYACVDACPFDVLQIEKYVAVVARPDECCGVVLCEQVCPNGSLTISEGEKLGDRPLVDAHLESKDVPGLYIAGDLTGLPLIKNAINQGVFAVDHIASTLKKRTDIDVLVVGAGPAGLSAALRAHEKDLACVVLEQATMASSIKSFPRDKLVYDPPLDLPVEGQLWLAEATKEELLAQWTRIVRTRHLDIREGRRVTSIVRDGDTFVATAEGERGAESYRASRVVMAIGRRGTPKTLEGFAVDPALEGRIAYALADARSFEGKKVLVVGLGDTAMEAAIAIARQPGTTVAISYRGTRFARGKTRNIAELQSLVAKGRVKIHFGSIPVSMTRAGVVLQTEGGARRTVAADAVLVLIGGKPSWDVLEASGLSRP